VFPVIPVPDNAPDRSEPLGTKNKFWYNDASRGVCLFKEIRAGTGEDWSETTAAFLCSLLSIPHADYFFALWNGKRGVITPVLHNATERMILGNELLGGIVPEYREATTPRGANRFHTVENVFLRLADCGPPAEILAPHGVLSAPEVFVGYLMLDALICNTDRHHENWGVIDRQDGTPRRLAPTFDHASCLAHNMPEAQRKERLITRDTNYTIEAYADRATSAFYATPYEKKPMGTIAAFVKGAEQYPDAALYWLSQLATLSGERIKEGLENIPDDRMTVEARALAQRMLEHNQRRLLETRSNNQ
jgi:hypothetical protein